MTDRHRVYTKVLQTLKRQLKMHRQGHVVTLAMMITGIVMSHKAQLAVMSGKVPTGAKEKSTEMRMRRWVKHEKIEIGVTYRPFARQILAALASAPLVSAMDGSTIQERPMEASFRSAVASVDHVRGQAICWDGADRVKHDGAGGVHRSGRSGAASAQAGPGVRDHCPVGIVAQVRRGGLFGSVVHHLNSHLGGDALAQLRGGDGDRNRDDGWRAYSSSTPIGPTSILGRCQV